jgi:hypothetical protein
MNTEISLRAYYAGLFMQQRVNVIDKAFSGTEKIRRAEIIAKEAVIMADILIDALNKPKGDGSTL